MITVIGSLGLVVLRGLLFALHELGEYAPASISIIAAIDELLKFEHVFFDHSILLGIFDMMRLWPSKENLFASLDVVEQIHAIM